MGIYTTLYEFYQRNDLLIQRWVDDKIYTAILGCFVLELIRRRLVRGHLSIARRKAAAALAASRLRGGGGGRGGCTCPLVGRTSDTCGFLLGLQAFAFTVFLLTLFEAVRGRLAFRNRMARVGAGGGAGGVGSARSSSAAGGDHICTRCTMDEGEAVVRETNRNFPRPQSQ